MQAASLLYNMPPLSLSSPLFDGESAGGGGESGCGRQGEVSSARQQRAPSPMPFTFAPTTQPSNINCTAHADQQLLDSVAYKDRLVDLLLRVEHQTDELGQDMPADLRDLIHSSSRRASPQQPHHHHHAE